MQVVLCPWSANELSMASVHHDYFKSFNVIAYSVRRNVTCSLLDVVAERSAIMVLLQFMNIFVHLVTPNYEMESLL